MSDDNETLKDEIEYQELRLLTRAVERVTPSERRKINRQLRLLGEIRTTFLDE